MTISMDTPGLLEHIQQRLVSPEPDCLIWGGAIDRGYGRILIDGRARRVHRVVWELHNGPIPDGLTVDHLCRIRSCVNPEHLELVSNAENIRRAHESAKGVTHWPGRGRGPGGVRKPAWNPACLYGHAFDDANTRIDARGVRACRACGRRRQAEYQERLNARAS